MLPNTGAIHHFHLDHLGTPRLITDQNHTQVAYHAYFPFGEEATPFNQDTERMKFTGHERDLASLAGTGDDLDYMHARHESPVTGRFLSVDSHQGESTSPQSWNRYAYVRDSPLKLVDLIGGAKTFFAEHRAMFRGFSPFPTTGGEAAVALILPELKLGSSLARFAGITAGMERFTGGQLAHFESQLAEDGAESLLKSRATLQGRILEHLDKITQAEKAGRFTSSMEREIRNFQQQINAIDQLLQKGGYTFIQGDLVRIVPPPK